jgi:hypothetical protein
MLVLGPEERLGLGARGGVLTSVFSFDILDMVLDRPIVSYS